MRSFEPNYLAQLSFHPGTAWFLMQCGEARGMQELWRRVRPEILKSLMQSTLVQSVESSNRIEGVEVEKERLVPLVLGNSRPKNRSEEESAGYC